MKKQGKGFITGFLTAILVLGLSVPALAAYQKQATLNYDNIKISIDGKAVSPTDANGNAVEPFILEGTTYLPVRAVGNALGLEVGWEQETKTATLKNKRLAAAFTLSAGEYIVGVDAPSGKYSAVAAFGGGHFFVHNSTKTNLKVNEVFGVHGAPTYLSKIDIIILADGDKIGITHDLGVTFTPLT